MSHFFEKKVSLVGWGRKQVVFHSVNGHAGVGVFDRNRLTLFGLTPWLNGLVAVVPPCARYEHTAPAPEHAELVQSMRQSAFEDAIEALHKRDVHLLAEAVSTTYMAQQYMGGELLPNFGEIGKRFAGTWGVYVFPTQQAVGEALKNHSVLTT